MLSTVYHKKAFVLKIPPNLPLPKGGVGRLPFPKGDNKDYSHICIKFLPTHFHDEPLFYYLRNIFGDGRGSGQPRGFNPQKMNPPLFLFLDHKICLQLTLIVNFRAIA